MPLVLGVDVGSSSVKACLLSAETGRPVAEAASPEGEMEISAPFPGWAEQDPGLWWRHLKFCMDQIKSKYGFDPSGVKAVGIAYQMHGLVLVGRNNEVLRPAIIWCDSRAVETGRAAEKKIGRGACLKKLHNLPGNFTASRLKWVMENEPGVYKKTRRFLLPGDYMAMRMTGGAQTTAAGLSEGIFWDFTKAGISDDVIEAFGFRKNIFPPVVPVFSVQGTLTADAADDLGLRKDTPVSYRAGDQPNGAFSLGALLPGDVAASAGTSGVVYAVTDKNFYDKKSRVNVFSHVNDSPEARRLGVLMCLNGAGILYSWIRRHVVRGASYNKLNCLAMEAPPGSAGVMCFPFGNGAERTLGNIDPGASFEGLRFNSHEAKHMIRAAQEGVVFALNYGMDIMREGGVGLSACRAGLANMFLSKLFRTVFAGVSGLRLELFRTGGAQGAARGAGFGAGIFKTLEDAFAGLEALEIEEPSPVLAGIYGEAYSRWKSRLETRMLGLQG